MENRRGSRGVKEREGSRGVKDRKSYVKKRKR
jgi:hypothetical protein